MLFCHSIEMLGPFQDRQTDRHVSTLVNSHLVSIKISNYVSEFSLLFTGELVTAMYDNFVAYRAKMFRPESPLAAPKNGKPDPDRDIERNPL